MRANTLNGPKWSFFVLGSRTGSASPVHAKRTGLVEPAFGAVRNVPRSLLAPPAPRNRKKYLVLGLSSPTLRWTVPSVLLRACSRKILVPRCSFLSRATMSPIRPGLSARVHSSADLVLTSAEATPLEKPLAEATAGGASSSASSASGRRARDMAAAYLGG